jgi:hypothetical protein
VTSCPRCGAPAERGQLVCLECGSRIALDYRRPYGALPALAILLAVVVVGAAAFGFALSEITSDSEKEVASADRAEQPAPAANPGAAQTATEEEEGPVADTGSQTETTPAAPEGGGTTGTPQEPTRSLLLEWPKDLTAHTVVLVTSSDRPAARNVAIEAARSGIEAGMLRADDFNLGTGLWIVFAGRFDTREGAVKQAANLGERYPGAYPQLVQPAG